ncbi:hypothetical protein TB1_022113 [Malus domestica]
MEENHVVAFESIANGDHHGAASTTVNYYNNTYHTHANNNHGWQKVTVKCPRKKKESNAKEINNLNKLVPDIMSGNENGVFWSLEKQPDDRHHRILEAQRANVDLDDVALARSKLRSDDKDRDNSDDEAATQYVKADEAKKGRIAINFH